MGQGVAHGGQGYPMGVRGAPGRAGVANRVAEMSQRALGLTHKVLGGGPWTNLSGTVVVRGYPWGSGVPHGGQGCSIGVTEK